MTTARELLEKARWFPGKTATGMGAGAPADNTTLATNGFLSALLPPEDRDRLRQINVRLTELAIAQCAAGARAGIEGQLDGWAANQVDFGTQACTTLADFAAHGVFPDELRKLSREHDVVFPWSLSYGNVRTPFNLRLTRLPLAIAFPRTVEEVVFWVGFVREHGLSVSIRSGNNSYEGFSSSNQVVIDLTFLTLSGSDAHFELDAKAGLVHAAPGIRLGVLYTELAKQSFVLAGGQCAPVCVGGLVGTGGIGFLTRAFGWACDQLVEVECVLADGSVVTANADNEYADLYRACKGAGAAGLCVMTRLTLKVHPAKPVLWYSVNFNLDDLDEETDGLAHGARVLAAWQNLSTAPDALSSVFVAIAGTEGMGLLSVSGEFRVECDSDSDWDEAVQKAECELREILQSQWLDLLPPPLNQAPILIAATSPAEAATLAALIVPMPIWNQWKIKNKFTFRTLTAEELAPVFDYLRNNVPGDDPTTGVGYLSPWLVGGKSNRIDPESAVMPVRECAVMWIHAGAQWNDPAVESQALAFVDGLWKALEFNPDCSTALYGCSDIQLGSQLTHPPDYSYLQAYWSSPQHDFVDFLIGVKNKYDSCDLFKFAQSIPLTLDGPEE